MVNSKNVEVDSSACTDVIDSVRRRARLMLLGLVLEFLLLLAIAGLTLFLLSFLPPTSLFIVWAVFGLLISACSVIFRIRNSRGLWRATAESSYDLLRLSQKRVTAIAKSARFNRCLTIIFSIALPLWTGVVWWRDPAVLLRNTGVTLVVFAIVILSIFGYWYFCGRMLMRCTGQLAAVNELLAEFKDNEPPNG